MSYIGLWSYYNFDNWTYQPSYVSSNTPWFFNGVRVQWFPTDKLEDRAVADQRLAVVRQVQHAAGHRRSGPLCADRHLILIFNQYFLGADILGAPDRHRFHTDDGSGEVVREQDTPSSRASRPRSRSTSAASTAAA